MLRKTNKKLVIYTIFGVFVVSVIVLTILFFVVWYPLHYKDIITKYSKQYKLEANLVSSVIRQESNYNPDAVSYAGAIGLMQLLPSTAKEVADKLGEEYSVSKLYDAETNIKYGCYYLHYLYGLYADSVCVLAAYNAGMGNVNAWLGNKDYSDDGVHLKYIPFKETREYVYKVLSRRAMYKIYW